MDDDFFYSHFFIEKKVKDQGIIYRIHLQESDSHRNNRKKTIQFCPSNLWKLSKIV